MKKILIAVLIILLLILTCFSLVRGINFLKIKSIGNIKAAGDKLEADFNEANELSNKTYPAEVEGLENAIKQLKISKQQFESKSSYNNMQENPLDTLEIRTYKIHYLWTILGNHRKDTGVQSLKLDLKSTENENVYDLEFTSLGTYMSITDFIYDLENDEKFNFEIKNFSITSQVYNAEEENQKKEEEQKKNDGITLQAKFTVEDIGITLD